MIKNRLLARWRFPLAILLIWLLCALALLFQAREMIANFDFRDPDDALRLVEVRDWMAGQNWFDVTQYRIHPPTGGAIHWSRLIDVPIAAFLWAVSLFTPVTIAERLVLPMYPLLVLGLLFAIVGCAMHRLAGKTHAIISVMLLALTMPVLIQFAPMRIDHHGWQIIMAALALYGSLLPCPRRSGIVSGIALSIWLNISSEALPYAALFGALYALKYLRDAAEWERLSSYLMAITAGSVGLLFATHGWAASQFFYCDAISPTYLLPMGAATLLLLSLKALLSNGRLANRLTIVGSAGAGAVVVLSLVGGECLAGPFKALDPLVYRYWYLNVSEGLPIWEQGASTVMILLVGPALGFASYMLAVPRQKDNESKAVWTELLFLAAGAFVLSMLVLRAISISYLYMLPGNAWLLWKAMCKARTLERAWLRIIASVATILLIPFIPTAYLSSILPTNAQQAPADRSREKKLAECTHASGLRGLGALPAATLFTPLDVGPYILVHTHHRVIATGHHRNEHAMAKVLKAFMSPEAKAHQIIIGTRSDYLVYCPERSEIRHFIKHAPHGLAARLEAGKTPSWLQPVAMPKGEVIRVYRILN